MTEPVKFKDMPYERPRPRGREGGVRPPGAGAGRRRDPRGRRRRVPREGPARPSHADGRRAWRSVTSSTRATSSMTPRPPSGTRPSPSCSRRRTPSPPRFSPRPSAPSWRRSTARCSLPRPSRSAAPSTPRSWGDMKRENALAQEYVKLIASAQIPFEGGTYTLSQLTPFKKSADDAQRLAAWKAEGSWYKEHQADFDRIYDELTHVRDAMGKLGYENYLPLGYDRMGRLSYGREDVGASARPCAPMWCRWPTRSTARRAPAWEWSTRSPSPTRRSPSRSGNPARAAPPTTCSRPHLLPRAEPRDRRLLRHDARPRPHGRPLHRGQGRRRLHDDDPGLQRPLHLCQLQRHAGATSRWSRTRRATRSPTT